MNKTITNQNEETCTVTLNTPKSAAPLATLQPAAMQITAGAKIVGTALHTVKKYRAASAVIGGILAATVVTSAIKSTMESVMDMATMAHDGNAQAVKAQPPLSPPPQIKSMAALEAVMTVGLSRGEELSTQNLGPRNVFCDSTNPPGSTPVGVIRPDPAHPEQGVVEFVTCKLPALAAEAQPTRPNGAATSGTTPTAQPK